MPHCQAPAHSLDRFVAAQHDTYDAALSELRQGRKQSHWMWFIFPQHQALGRSAMAKHYGIASQAEALAYLAHPLLGKRLLECTGLMLAVNGKTALDILGATDERKFHSCMTLFQAARPDLPVWNAALHHYFGGTLDAATLALL